MARRRQTKQDQAELFEARVATAPCVPAIREAVAKWRESDYSGITDTTRKLLNHWFKAEHRLPNRRKFKYHNFQRDAIETLVYLYEVAGVRRQKELLETYARQTDLRLLRYDDFARYCVKMGTGTGKTKVMSHAVAEARDDYAKTFLILAPNVIVFERLRADFANGRIFTADPVIPPELRVYWEFEVYLRGDPERASSLGALYLTNVQQLYDRPNATDSEPEEMTGVLGPKPPAEKQEIGDFDKRIVARGGPVVVINDEAHHTHDEVSEWNKVIRGLHTDSPKGLLAQLDFTATPRHSKGSLFTWTVFDYPLKQAIIDNVVKQPIKGIATGITERPSTTASVRYQSYLTAGVERWREYRDLLAPLGKKPVLFVMMSSTAEADEVGDWLRRKYPGDFAGEKLLIIHTDTTGEVSKKDVDKARGVARTVDEETSPVNCIVSVLMLREGWDVQSVTVVVGLRPYTAKANILPEQTIGRGLRLMFRDLATTYPERVDVIGNDAFIQFVEDLERQEELDLATFEIGVDRVEIVTIMPDPEKMDKDIAVPMLSPILTRKKSLSEEIAALDVTGLECPTLPREEGDEAAVTFTYEGYDIITLKKVVEREYRIPEPQTAEEVIGYYAQRIAREVKLPSQFAALVPKVREFLATRAFGEPVDLSSAAMVKAISTNVAHYVTVRTFVQALRDVVVQKLEPQLVGEPRRLSETPPFPVARATLSARKTVFNLVACDNELEVSFARFLENAGDVDAFAKLPEQFGFAIEYTDSVGNLRYYEPDFLVRLSDGSYCLAETKGQEGVEVAYKDRAAALWCEYATRLAGVAWKYVKVRQPDFERLQPTLFGELACLEGPEHPKH
jgi:type III restriction enzyme